MGYVKVTTFTNPEALPIKRVMELLTFSQPHVSNMIKDGRLDHGYTFDRGCGGADSGELLVILNDKYHVAMTARQQKIQELFLKEARLSIQEATILTGKPEPELIDLIANGFLTYKIDPNVMSGYLVRDRNLEALISKQGK